MSLKVDTAHYLQVLLFKYLLSFTLIHFESLNLQYISNEKRIYWMGTYKFKLKNLT